MDIQKSLIPEKTKEELLQDLFLILQQFKKTINNFGCVNSKVMIIGESCVKSHLDSDSNSPFMFDKNLHQNTKSGGVLIQIFRELGLRIEDFYWTNLYKILIDRVTDHDLFHKIIEKEIEIIQPEQIICLGKKVFDIIDNCDRSVHISVVQLKHPAYLLYGGISFNEYLNTWKLLSLEN